MRSFAKLLVPALAVAACGDNLTVERPIDASTDTAVADAPTDAATDAAIDAPAIDAVDAAIIDAPDIDALVIDAPIDAPIDASVPSLAPHLLITEVKTVDNSEFIEIYNPTNAPIDLRNYYLTDHQSYFLLPGVVAGNTTQPVTDASDFLARFPAGATIAPRAVITVAFDAVGYEAGLMSVPTYTIQELGNSVAMEILWIGATTPNPGLTNAGEMAALFFWDGMTDTVKDVDIFVAGNAPTAANTIVAKTPATMVDGPDADTTATPYALDVPNAMFDQATDTPNGTSYKRILFEAGMEIQLNTGNGITGDDETSENIRTTWDSQAVATGYTAPTPGVVPVTLNPVP